MDQDAPGSDPDSRWLLLLHVLFAVTLGVPTIVVAVSGAPGAPGTIGIAAAFAAWYLALFAAGPPHADRGIRMLVYAVGAVAFFTALNIRDGGYVLLIYSLLPQFFSRLSRSLAVLGVVCLVLMPATVTGGVGTLLRDPGALFNLLASVGLGLAVTAVMEALGRQSQEQRATIAALERARTANERLLAAARRDADDRAALARAGHALIAARTHDEVATAIGEQLGGHSADVRGVALLADEGTVPDAATVVATASGTVSPAVGATVTVPRKPADGEAVVLTGDELRDAPLPGVAAVALLSLRGVADSDASDGSTAPVAGADPGLLWIALGDAGHDEAALRDLSTVAAETALALANLRLTTHAAAQGRTAGVLAERQRLAHDIHDTLAQGFTSIVTQLEAAEQALTDDTPRAATHLERAKRTARDSLGEARRTVEALRPEPLERAGLTAALKDLAARWRDSQPRPIGISVTIDGEPARVPPKVDDALLRVAQEALGNIGRHAEARNVDVTLSYVDNLVLLDVQDDGVGFDVGVPPGHDDVSDGGYGLISMRERVTVLGGALTVESTRGDGTTVAARIPRRPAPALPEERP